MKEQEIAIEIINLKIAKEIKENKEKVKAQKLCI